MSDIQQYIATVRKDYASQSLDEQHIDKNHIKQFEKWFDEAVKAEVPEPNAMTLATATANGKPSTRIVLLRGFDEKGFVFYTNYSSKKGMELIKNPYASLNFFWHEIERQVRIEGKIEKVSPKQSDEYFASRPKGSQLGAWASTQSRVIKNREELEAKMLELEIKYKTKTVPRPPYWGGFCLSPTLIEFWQGRPNRLHDRIQYELQQNGKWIIQRLAP